MDSLLKRISVAGDLTIKHMIVEDEPVWESERVSPTPQFRDYDLLVGAFHIEFLLSACSQYVHLTELIQKNKSVSYKQIRKCLDESSKLVDGPSTLNLPRDAKLNIPRLHYTVRPTSCLAPNRRTDKRYRMSAKRGRTNVSASTNPVAQFLNNPQVMVLSVDYDCFCRSSFKDYLCPTSDITSVESLVMRLAVNPNSDLKGASNIKKFNQNLKGLLDRFGNAQTKIAVISAEALRRCGYDVSYRVTWERTITDVANVLNSRIQSHNGGSEDWDLRILNNFDYVVVTFYNDGALAVPITSDRSQKAIFVSDPTSIERDFVSSYTGFTRGTETLICSAIAYQLGYSHSKFDDIHDKLQIGMIRGLKASRFLQAHGLVTPEPNVHLLQQANKKISPESKESLEKDDLGRALLKIHEQQPSINDCILFLWNRLCSSVYCNSVSRFLGSSLAERRPHVWPYGDLVEIIVWGYPVYGSFPPTAINRAAGRAAITKTCDLTLQSWQGAGWLSVAHLTLAEISKNGHPSSSQNLIERSQVSDHDRSWWSFENHAIHSLAYRLVTSPVQSIRKREELVREVLCASIIKFGYSSINVCNIHDPVRFDHMLMKLMMFGPTDILRPSTKQTLRTLDRRATIEKLLNTSVPPGIPLEEAFNLAIKNSSRNNPDFSSLLEIVPEFRIGRLFTTDRRDSQNYREIRERIINYRHSEDRKPLNIGVFGQAGSGKSFGVKEIIKNVFGEKDIEFLEFNVAQFGDEQVLVDAMLEIQNASLQGKMPVAFWDEYDTYKDGVALGWLSYFLGPMQDSAFFLHQRLRYLPKCIFVFAGSMFQSFGEMKLLDRLATTGVWNANDRETTSYTAVGNFKVSDWKHAKGADFKSRLTAVLDISGVNPPQPTKIVPRSKVPNEINVEQPYELVNLSMLEDADAYMLRRARGIRSAFEMNASELIDPVTKVLSISGSLLERLLHTGTYIHGQRSIENLTKMSSIRGHGQADNSFIPSSGQIRIHTDPKLLDESPEERDRAIEEFRTNYRMF